MGVKVKVDLEVATDKLANTIQQSVARGFRGGATQGLATSPASVIKQILGQQGAGMKGYRDTMGGYSLPATPDFLNDPKFLLHRGTPPPTIASIQERNRLQQAQFLKNIGFAGIPVLSPTSVLGNLFASRQIFSGLSGLVGQRLLGGIGVGGTAGTAAATGVVMAGLLAIGASLKALQITIRETAHAFEEARKLYARSLLSGLGLQFTIGRKNLADVLGVSEKEVMQFGAAIGVLGPKLRFATDVMARTTPNLASVAYEFKILGKDLEALFFTLANDAAPSLRIFADGISKLLEAFTRFLEHDPVAKMIKELFVGAPSQALQLIGKLLGGKDSGPAMSPQGLMKQLPASHLERMGLVVGGFGVTSDAAQRTAKASERSAKLLEKISNQLSGNGSFSDPLVNMP